MILQKDHTGDTVDRYGRWLRYVLLDETTSTPGLIRDGYAHAYRRFPFSQAGRSLYDSKNKRGGEGSAYGTAARTRPPRTLNSFQAQPRPTTPQAPTSATLQSF